MPQLQILNRSPGFGEQLGQALGGGLSQGISGALTKMLETKKNRKGLEGLFPLLEKTSGIQLSPEEKEMWLSSGLKPETAIPFMTQLSKNKAATDLAQQKQAGETKSTSSNIQKPFDTMSKMLKQNLSGIGIDPFTALGTSREGVQNRAMFDSMRANFESVFKDMVNAGQMSDKRFAYIMGLVPKGNESQRKIAGKLGGLSVALSEEGMPIDTSILETIPWYKETVEKIEKGEPKKAGERAKEEFFSKITEEKPKKDEIKTGQTFSKLPPAKDFPNGIMSKGGNRYKSDGKTWKEIP